MEEGETSYRTTISSKRLDERHGALRIAHTSISRSITEADIRSLHRTYEDFLKGEQEASRCVIYIQDVSALNATPPLSMQSCMTILNLMLGSALLQRKNLRAIVIHVNRLDELARAVASAFLAMYTFTIPLHFTDSSADAERFLVTVLEGHM